jgi:hypothetical protein
MRIRVHNTVCMILFGSYFPSHTRSGSYRTKESLRFVKRLRTSTGTVPYLCNQRRIGTFLSIKYKKKTGFYVKKVGPGLGSDLTKRFSNTTACGSTTLVLIYVNFFWMTFLLLATRVLIPGWTFRSNFEKNSDPPTINSREGTVQFIFCAQTAGKS